MTTERERVRRPIAECAKLDNAACGADSIPQSQARQLHARKAHGPYQGSSSTFRRFPSRHNAARCAPRSRFGMVRPLRVSDSCRVEKIVELTRWLPRELRKRFLLHSVANRATLA